MTWDIYIMGVEQKSFEKAGIRKKIPAIDMFCALMEGNPQPQLKMEIRSA